jgi:hypothetical protein
MRKLFLALVLLATVASAPAFVGRLDQVGGARERAAGSVGIP